MMEDLCKFVKKIMMLLLSLMTSLMIVFEVFIVFNAWLNGSLFCQRCIWSKMNFRSLECSKKLKKSMKNDNYQNFHRKQTYRYLPEDRYQSQSQYNFLSQWHSCVNIHREHRKFLVLLQDNYSHAGKIVR